MVKDVHVDVVTHNLVACIIYGTSSKGTKVGEHKQGREQQMFTICDRFQKCLGIKDTCMSDRLIIYITANRVASADGNVLRQNSRGQ